MTDTLTNPPEPERPRVRRFTIRAVLPVLPVDCPVCRHAVHVGECRARLSFWRRVFWLQRHCACAYPHAW